MVEVSSTQELFEDKVGEEIYFFVSFLEWKIQTDRTKKVPELDTQHRMMTTKLIEDLKEEEVGKFVWTLTKEVCRSIKCNKNGESSSWLNEETEGGAKRKKEARRKGRRR